MRNRMKNKGPMNMFVTFDFREPVVQRKPPDKKPVHYVSRKEVAVRMRIEKAMSHHKK